MLDIPGQNDSNGYVPSCRGCLRRVIASGVWGDRPSFITPRMRLPEGGTVWCFCCQDYQPCCHLLPVRCRDDVLHCREYIMWVQWRAWNQNHDNECDSDPEDYIIDHT